MALPSQSNSILLPTLPPPPTTVPKWQGFVFGTVAAPMAVLFTNPFDTAKVCYVITPLFSCIIGKIATSGAK